MSFHSSTSRRKAISVGLACSLLAKEGYQFEEDSQAKLTARLTKFWEAFARKHDEGTFLMGKFFLLACDSPVSHGGIVRTLTEVRSGKDEPVPPYCSITKFVFENVCMP